MHRQRGRDPDPLHAGGDEALGRRDLVAAAVLGVAWLLGAAISVGTFAGFVLSRTVGLPGLKEHEWELLGIVSLVVEDGFLALFAIREQRAVARALTTPVPAPGRAPGPPPARSLSGLVKEPGARELELAKA